jgi:hypothetical protein
MGSARGVVEKKLMEMEIAYVWLWQPSSGPFSRQDGWDMRLDNLPVVPSAGEMVKNNNDYN